MEKRIYDVAAMVNEILTFVRGSAQEMEIGAVERRLLSLGGCRLTLHILSGMGYERAS